MNRISKKYSQFFKNNYKEKYLILCGGRRSAKTYSTFSYLYSIASIVEVKIVVLTFSFATLQLTMEDFTNCLGLEINNTKLGYRSILPNGSIFQFEHKDDPTKALGTQCDFLFVNESCNLPESVFDSYSPGVRVQSIFNYNPTSIPWTDKLINESGSNFLRTTWKDNKYLTESQKGVFEELKTRYLSPNHSALDEFNYYVYYLGETAKISGLVFPKVERISISDYKQIPSCEFLGLDFGFSIDGDPTALIGVKIYQDCIYAREYFCEKGLNQDKDLYDRIIDCDVEDPDDCYIFFDSGGQGLSRANNLIRDFDLPLKPAIKKNIMDNISEIVSYQKICVAGDNLFNELTTTELDGKTGKLKCPKGDHCTDAMRYGFNTAKQYIRMR